MNVVVCSNLPVGVRYGMPCRGGMIAPYLSNLRLLSPLVVAPYSPAGTSLYDIAGVPCTGVPVSTGEKWSVERNGPL